MHDPILVSEGKGIEKWAAVLNTEVPSRDWALGNRIPTKAFDELSSERRRTLRRSPTVTRTSRGGGGKVEHEI